MQSQSELDLDRLAEEFTLRREIDEDDTIRYYNEEGEKHRVHGPAVIWEDGTKFWYQNNKSHRLDGPAVIHPDGYKRWFIDGIRYTENEFNAHPLIVQHRAKAML